MDAPVSLTPTSFVVLGLVGRMGPVTPYDMEQRVRHSIGYFWPFPHSQLYAEPARLAKAGLLDEDVEVTGRRRRTYRLTPAGRAALLAWLAEPAAEPTEIRDLGLLKLFFSAEAADGDRRRLAADQEQAHERRREEYEAIRQAIRDTATPAELATLEMGLRFERAAAAFWRELGDA